MSDGSVYAGAFEDNLWHGEGILLNSDGNTRYWGDFEEGQKHGVMTRYEK